MFTIVGENTNPFQIGRGLESKLIDVATSARFKTKANPDRSRKVEHCQLPLEWNTGRFYHKYFLFLV